MSNVKRVVHCKTYINVMELLVAEEVDKQLQNVPQRVLKYINRSEVETFALNRLPTLYASSEKGLQYQRARALHELQQPIFNAVRQAFVAVQVDPIRLSQPIQLEDADREAEAVLQALRDWLHVPDLTWKAALRKLQKLRRQPVADGQTTRSARRAESARRVTSKPSAAVDKSSWHPGSYDSQIGWKGNRPNSESGGGGFDDTYLR